MYKKTVNDVLNSLNSTRRGLSENIANSRMINEGKNEVEKTKKMSFLKCFFKQFLNIMVGILLFSAVVSLTIALINHEYEDLFEGCVILFIVIMNALIGVFQEYKAQACIAELQKYNKTNVKVIRDGVINNIDSTELVRGDIVEMQAGNVVMADIRLIETNNFACDESSLTGESIPAEKDADTIFNADVPLGERVNMAYSGSLITAGKATGVVVATGKNTELGKKILNKTYLF